MVIRRDFPYDLPVQSGRFTYLNGNYEGRGKIWKSQILGPQESEIFPGVWQGSLAWRNVQWKFHQELQIMFDNVKPNEYFSGDLSPILTDYAMPANLAPYAPDDVGITRRAYKLREPTVEELKLFRAYVRAIMAKGRLERVVHSKVSSVGATSFAISQEFRKASLLWLFNSPANLRYLHNVIVNWKIDDMLKLYFLPVYTQGTRKHSCKGYVEKGQAIPTKERFYITTQNVLNHSYNLSKVDFYHPADRRLFAYDVRSMYGAPSLPNVLCQIVNNFLTAGLKQFEPFRYNGEIELSKRLKMKINESNDHVVFSLDKSKFGDTFAPKLVQIVIEELYSIFDGYVCDIIREMLEWPSYFRSFERGVRGHILTRDFSPVPNLNRFNSTFKSGNGLVSSLGQIIGGFDAILHIRKHLGGAFNLDKAMNNMYRGFGFFNKGDDTLWVAPKSFQNNFDATVSLHADSLEKFPVFLGYVYAQDGTACTDIVRWCTNTVCHERGMSSKTFPALGYRSRLDLYASNPYIEETASLFSRICSSETGFQIERFMDRNTDVLVFDNLNEAEKQFIANPDLIYYKEDIMKEVREDLVDVFFSSTDISVFANVLRGVS